MQKLVRLIISCLLIFIAIRCAPLRDSPYSSHILRDERDLNNLNIAALSDIDADTQMVIAVFADSHQNYRKLRNTISHINRTPFVDFVVNLGDATNKGTNMEYDHFAKAYEEIRRPKFSVPGNHDTIGAGLFLFEQIFGPLNFYFESASHRFIFFNSNNWETPLHFNSLWLRDTVSASTKPVLIFSHIGLADAERFSNGDGEIFSEILNDPKVRLTVHGHNDGQRVYSVSGTWTVQTPRIGSLGWILLKIQGNDLSVSLPQSGLTSWYTLKSGF
ncbi:metallophosphoesterase family protein [Pseudobdellovibrio sp. HCB154]|uniref:metallophosphoesterase family protein n=1 Tax=Pseudobdellovibrio sp. HCB154 TaxID=3386277 RepID=UPI00391732EA